MKVISREISIDIVMYHSVDRDRLEYGARIAIWRDGVKHYLVHPKAEHFHYRSLWGYAFPEEKELMEFISKALSLTQA